MKKAERLGGEPAPDISEGELQRLLLSAKTEQPEKQKRNNRVVQEKFDIIRFLARMYGFQNYEY